MDFAEKIKNEIERRLFLHKIISRKSEYGEGSIDALQGILDFIKDNIHEQKITFMNKKGNNKNRQARKSVTLPDWIQRIDC